MLQEKLRVVKETKTTYNTTVERKKQENTRKKQDERQEWSKARNKQRLLFTQVVSKYLYPVTCITSFHNQMIPYTFGLSDP